MARTLSTTAIQAILAQTSDVAWSDLLTITHVSLANPIRITNNESDIVSGGQTFTALGFAVHLPDQTPDRLSRVSVRIDNASQELTAAIRNINSPPTDPPVVLLEVVHSADLDNPEVTLTLDWLAVSITDHEVAGTIGVEESIANDQYPGITMAPGNFAGLFTQVSSV